MTVIAFRSAIVARTLTGAVVIALMDGGEPEQCVALLMCSQEAAKALCAALGSELNA